MNDYIKSGYEHIIASNVIVKIIEEFSCFTAPPVGRREGGGGGYCLGGALGGNFQPFNKVLFCYMFVTCGCVNIVI